MRQPEVPRARQTPQEKIRFHPEQLRWLRTLFPQVVLGADSTPAEMHQYFGAQRVLAVIEETLK